MISTSKIKVNSIDYMITSSCNLNCEFCDRFSNFKLSWFEDLNTFEKNIAYLSKRIDFNTFDLQGGEPLLHPKINEMLEICRFYLPKTQIGTFSNGFLLGNNPNLINTLIKIKPSTLKITLHFREKEQQDIIFSNIKKHILDNHDFKIVSKNNLIIDDSIELVIRDHTKDTWTQHYQIIDGKIKPFKDNDPEKSYSICNQHGVLAAFSGKLYKCATISQLKLFAKKYELSEDKDWVPYLKYSGLDIDSCIDSYNNFFKTQHIANPTICSMCPSDPGIFSKQKKVTHKSNYYKKQ